MRDICDGVKTTKQKSRLKKCQRTYNDDAANEHKVPYQVLLLREFGIVPFYLAKIGIYEIRVKEHTQVFRRDEEARCESMDRWWELQQHGIMEEEAIYR